MLVYVTTGNNIIRPGENDRSNSMRFRAFTNGNLNLTAFLKLCTVSLSMSLMSLGTPVHVPARDSIFH